MTGLMDYDFKSNKVSPMLDETESIVASNTAKLAVKCAKKALITASISKDKFTEYISTNITDSSTFSTLITCITDAYSIATKSYNNASNAANMSYISSINATIAETEATIAEQNGNLDETNAADIRANNETYIAVEEQRTAIIESDNVIRYTDIIISEVWILMGGDNKGTPFISKSDTENIKKATEKMNMYIKCAETSIKHNTYTHSNYGISKPYLDILTSHIKHNTIKYIIQNGPNGLLKIDVYIPNPNKHPGQMTKFPVVELNYETSIENTIRPWLIVNNL